MAKPYPGYKGNNLVNINPKAIAFVTEGANMKKFFLYKSKTNNNGEKTMEKTVAISLLKTGNLTKEQENTILNAVDPSDLREVMKFAKSSDPEGNSMSSFMKEFLPQIAKAVTDEIKKADESEDIKLIREVLDKLNQLLANEEGEDDGLAEAIDEVEKGCDKSFADLKDKKKAGTLSPEEAKTFDKMCSDNKEKAKKSLTEKKIKAEKEAIEALSASEDEKNKKGEMGAEGFDKVDGEPIVEDEPVPAKEEDELTEEDKKVKKIFEGKDRDITDPTEIANLLMLAERGVENGVL